MRPWILVLALSGCVSNDEMLAALDRDGDGAYDPAAAELGEAGPFDCDDDDDQIGPSIAEACNGIDDDCDGSTDEAGATGEQTWFTDADEDGYGDATGVVACVAPTQEHVLQSGDCDDLDADVHPGIADPCDHVDNDCDGATDEEPPTWYFDADKDGFGDALVSSTICVAPNGYVADDQDCDDDDPAVNPEGVEECDGGVDNDCDDKIDNADDSNVGDATWYPDVDGDTYGDGANPVIACERPSGHVRNGLDCDDTSDLVWPDANEICEDGLDQDCNERDIGCGVYGEGPLSDASASFTAGSSGYFAIALAMGDLDGDGFADLAMPEPDASALAGRTWITYGGPATLTGDHEIADVADAWYDGVSASDLSGGGVAFAGDLDGDGHGDLAIGALEMSASRTGSVYLVYGTGTRASGAVSLASAPRLAGASANDQTGRPLATAGDFDGDRFDDLLVGAPEAAGTVEGRVYLLRGRSTRYSSSDSLPSNADIWLASSPFRALGYSLSGGYDVDGDGRDDAIVGAPRSDGFLPEGRAYVVLGGAASGTAVIDDVADLILEAEGTGSDPSEAGAAVSMGPDYDGDGLPDLAVGAPTRDDRGVAYVVSGATSWPWATTDLGTAALLSVTGSNIGDKFGGTVAMVGDLDGDLLGDLVVGAPAASSTDGAAYVFAGGTSGSFTALDADVTRTGTSSQKAGSVLPSRAGDVNGDGYFDLFVGANTFGVSPGAAWLLYGGP